MAICLCRELCALFLSLTNLFLLLYIHNLKISMYSFDKKRDLENSCLPCMYTYLYEITCHNYFSAPFKASSPFTDVDMYLLQFSLDFFRHNAHNVNNDNKIIREYSFRMIFPWRHNNAQEVSEIIRTIKKVGKIGRNTNTNKQTHTRAFAKT